jgi:hypothetical protein
LYMSSVTLISVIWCFPLSSSQLLSSLINCLYRPECSSVWSQNLSLVNHCFGGLTIKWPRFAYVNACEITAKNNQQYALIVPLLYSIYWHLHVSAVACHHQGAS